MSKKESVELWMLQGFVLWTSKVNYAFALPLAFLFNESSVNLTSIFTTGYGLNVNNLPYHINVGFQIFQLISIALNWSIGKWLNTLFAGILSIEFVIYFVFSILWVKSTTSIEEKEVTLYNIFDNKLQTLLVFLLLMIDIVTLVYKDTFTVQPSILGLCSLSLAFPETIPMFVSVALFVMGVIVHTYLSHLIV